MAEHGTPDLSSSGAPVHSGVGSKIGYRHHQPGRPAFKIDATETQADSQGQRERDPTRWSGSRSHPHSTKSFRKERHGYGRKEDARCSLVCAAPVSDPSESVRSPRDRQAS